MALTPNGIWIFIICLLGALTNSRATNEWCQMARNGQGNIILSFNVSASVTSSDSHMYDCLTKILPDVEEKVICLDPNSNKTECLLCNMYSFNLFYGNSFDNGYKTIFATGPEKVMAGWTMQIKIYRSNTQIDISCKYNGSLGANKTSPTSKPTIKRSPGNISRPITSSTRNTGDNVTSTPANKTSPTSKPAIKRSPGNISRPITSSTRNAGDNVTSTPYLTPAPDHQALAIAIGIPLAFLAVTCVVIYAVCWKRNQGNHANCQLPPNREL